MEYLKPIQRTAKSKLPIHNIGIVVLAMGCALQMAECCLKPDVPDHGFLSSYHETYNASDQVTLHCRKGYVPKGRNYAVCQSDGLWDQQFPSCGKDLAYLKATKIKVWDDFRKTFTEQATTDRLTNGEKDSCIQFPMQTEDYRLEIDLGQVYHIDSLAILLGIEGKNATMKVAVTDTTSGSNEEMCHQFHGNPSKSGMILECTSTGNIVSILLPQSQHLLSICTIQVLAADVKGCPKPDLPKNSYLTEDREIYLTGNTVTMLCNEDYLLTGRNYAVCQSDGLWDQPLPPCVKDVAFMKPVKIQVWDDSVNDLFPIEDDYILTDGQINTCLELHAGQDYYIEMDLKNTYYIDQILVGFAKPVMHIDLEIFIADTKQGSRRNQLCDKIHTSLHSIGIVVPCRHDDTYSKGDIVLFHVKTSTEPVVVCKIQVSHNEQQMIDNGLLKISSMDKVNFTEKTVHENTTEKTVHENTTKKIVPVDNPTIENYYLIIVFEVIAAIFPVILMAYIYYRRQKALKNANCWGPLTSNRRQSV